MAQTRTWTGWVPRYVAENMMLSTKWFPDQQEAPPSAKPHPWVYHLVRGLSKRRKDIDREVYGPAAKVTVTIEIVA